ncbi:MAG: ferrous iron transport protein B [Opitutales bacterium]|nr:ferrous iron transport protein B [Opitutales bacterium]
MLNENKPITIGVVGNPNTGKTSLFNCLTGLRQRVGNYPGITVERKLGTAFLGEQAVTLIDLPGTYSMAANSPDEEVVLDVLCGEMSLEQPVDLVLCVVDTSNLQRNLFLATQIADLGLPMVIALNMWDEAENRGMQIDVTQLSLNLGIPCIPTDAKRNAGLDELKNALKDAIQNKPKLNSLVWPNSVNQATEFLKKELGNSAPKDEARLRRILFDVDSILLRRIKMDAGAKKEIVQNARKVLMNDGLNPLAAEALLQYKHVGLMLEGIERSAVIRNRRTESIDRILMHRGWGLIVFMGLMYLVFQAVYSWSGPFMDLIDGSIGWLQDTAARPLESMPMLQSLVSDGIIGGIGAFLIFLPQILILFFFVSLLEDSGYMARAAFLMDKLFRWCGLNGKSFVPMLSSYACAIPGIMAARTIENPKARLATVLISPLISCSARLPVYILFIGAFIEPRYGAWWAGFTLFAMHLLGLLLSFPISWVLTRFILKTASSPFVLELPPYRAPKLGNVFNRMYLRGMDFLKTAGTIIFAMTILIWATLYFPRPESIEQETRASFIEEEASQKQISVNELETLLDDEGSEQGAALREKLTLTTETRYIEQSYLGQTGKFLQPIFEPAGYDWRVTLGIVSSFPAREVIISTMGIIYRLGDVDEKSDGLRDAMAKQVWQEGPRKGTPIFTIPMVLGLLVFFALCQQCAATIGVIAQEIGWKWALFSFTYMTILAWVGAVATYQIGMLFVS